MNKVESIPENFKDWWGIETNKQATIRRYDDSYRESSWKEERILQQRKQPWEQRTKGYEVLLGVYYGSTIICEVEGDEAWGRERINGLMPHTRKFELDYEDKWRAMAQFEFGMLQGLICILESSLWLCYIERIKRWRNLSTWCWKLR